MLTTQILWLYRRSVIGIVTVDQLDALEGSSCLCICFLYKCSCQNKLSRYSRNKSKRIVLHSGEKINEIRRFILHISLTRFGLWGKCTQETWCPAELCSNPCRPISTEQHWINVWATKENPCFTHNNKIFPCYYDIFSYYKRRKLILCCSEILATKNIKWSFSIVRSSRLPHVHGI